MTLKKDGNGPMRVAVKAKQRRVEPAPVLFPEMSENPWFTGREKQDREHRSIMSGLTTVELCAGAGGQALGYERAGIDHAALVELDKHACATLRLNRPEWNVLEQDLNQFPGSTFKGVDILCGGLPCPPFSIAGKQLGTKDERNLFPAMIRLVDEIRPRAVMIETVRGILDAVFEDYRQYVGAELRKLGYQPGWKLVNASDFGVPQLRLRVVFVALRKEYSEHFTWPEETRERDRKQLDKFFLTSWLQTGGQAQENGASPRTRSPRPSLAVLTNTVVPISDRHERGARGRLWVWMDLASPTKLPALTSKVRCHGSPSAWSLVFRDFRQWATFEF
jgi:site-specific DNA-cytosine methylase